MTSGVAIVQGLSEDDYLMDGSGRDRAARLFSLLRIRDLNCSEEAFEIFVIALAAISAALGVGDLSAMSELDFPCSKILASLSSDDIASLGSLVKAKRKSLRELDIIDSQISIQRLISQPKRKRLAAYYTKPVGLELMAQLAGDSTRAQKNPVVLADPFMGSGLTITAALKHFDTSMIRKVWGVEPHPLPALVAYASILHSLRGDYSKIDIKVGDIFETARTSLPAPSGAIGEIKDWAIPKADILIANPPFTRWELLEDDYRKLLWDLVNGLGYSGYVTRRQLNLQVASFFLMDYLLEDDGVLTSVLPASTFYTLYGEAIKSILKEKYQVRALIESKSGTSFSMDSGLKELILFAAKPKTRNEDKTAFVTLESDAPSYVKHIMDTLKESKLERDEITWVDLAEKSALAEANWSVFFAGRKLREAISSIFSKATKNGAVGVWSDIYGSQCIIRGVEMYGPDFFFLPNRHWQVAEEQSKRVIIENSEYGTRLDIPRDYLVPALRKPGLYLDAIEPEARHYLLSIPAIPARELPEGPARYVSWGKRKPVAQPAIRAFGRFWYSHVNKQIRTKKPLGRVFLPDKVDPTFRNRGLFASHSHTPLIASKNFHIVSLDDISKDIILTLWFNSTIFISYFILAGRKITKSWSRLLEHDYLRMPIIDLNSLDKRDAAGLEKVFQNISDRILPPMKQQLDSDYRRLLDRTLLDAIGVESREEDLNRIYSALEPNLR